MQAAKRLRGGGGITRLCAAAGEAALGGGVAGRELAGFVELAEGDGAVAALERENAEHGMRGGARRVKAKNVGEEAGAFGL